MIGLAVLAFVVLAFSPAPTPTTTPLPRLSGGFGRPKADSIARQPEARVADSGGAHSTSGAANASTRATKKRVEKLGARGEKPFISITDQDLITDPTKGRLTVFQGGTTALSPSPPPAAPVLTTTEASVTQRDDSLLKESNWCVTSALDRSNLCDSDYMEGVLKTIASNWFRPSVEGKWAAPVVYFRIQRDGTITRPQIEKSSGLAFVDRAALRAVLSSSPFPSLASDYRGTDVGLHLKFE